MTQALKPPAEPSVTPPPDELRQRVHEVLSNSSASQTKVAREAGISASALNQWLRGTYAGDNAAVESKLSSWLDMRDAAARTSLPQPPDWVETPTASRVMSALQYAQFSGDIALIYGGAGLGKTRAINRYSESFPSVFVVTSTAASERLSGLLEDMCDALAMREIPTRPSQIMRELVRRLKGTRGLIIVDEAQHLAFDALETLRSIHDATQIGLALVGNSLVYSKITGGSRSAHFAQLFSRIGKRVALIQPTEADVDALLESWGVAGADEIEVARQIAAQPGALRGLTKTLRQASLAGRADGGNVKAKHLRAAWRSLGGVL